MPQPRVPQRRKGRDRVAALMAAAAALFLEKGFDAVTMTEIAEQAGASIGTLYLFFPKKELLAQAIVAECGEDLPARLRALREGIADLPAAAIAGALFTTLGEFMSERPVYAALLDLPGDDRWRRSLRMQRRDQIAALFAQAKPPLAPGQAERLAVIVPQLMRIPLALNAEKKLREAILE
ncbi:MAG: TetR/AcrR family transcriptional regulator, partial [Bradyrhizobium sp.]